jgi:hypothetical protein
MRAQLWEGLERRNDGTRAVTITPKGGLVFRDEFDVRLE